MVTWLSRIQGKSFSSQITTYYIKQRMHQQFIEINNKEEQIADYIKLMEIMVETKNKRFIITARTDLMKRLVN